MGTVVPTLEIIALTNQTSLTLNVHLCSCSLLSIFVFMLWYCDCPVYAKQCFKEGVLEPKVIAVAACVQHNH